MRNSCRTERTIPKLTDTSRLEQERADWDDVVKSAAPESPTPRGDQPGLVSPLHSDLLDSSQRAIYEQLQQQAPSDSAKNSSSVPDPRSIQQRLQDISKDLEFVVDQFAHGVHALRTARDTAERVADKSLADAANALEERERQRSTVAGAGLAGNRSNQMAALRGLARVLNSKYQ